MGALARIPGRTLTTVAVQARRVTRRALGTASLERAVAGKVIVFTGAATEVERGAVGALRDAGAEVEVANAEHGVALGEPEAVERLAATVLDRFGEVDVLVNGTTAEPDAEGFEHAMQVGYFTPVRLTLAFLPGMRARRSGHIVNLHGSVPRAERATEAPRLSAHAALSSFSRCIAAEVLHDRVAVSAYGLPRSPGPGATADLCEVVATRPRRARA